MAITRIAGNSYDTFMGLASDTKPEEHTHGPIPNASVYFEMDTGNIYFYDEENARWLAV